MKVLVCDDQHKTALLLKRFIYYHYPLGSVDVVDTSWITQQTNLNEQLDLVFLVIDDLSLKGILFEFGKKLKEKNSDLKIVIISKYSEIASESFEMHPYYFFLKPIDMNLLTKVLSNLNNEIVEQKILIKYMKLKTDLPKMIIRNKEGVLWVDYNNILFLEKINKDVYIHTTNGIKLTKQNLSDLEETLPNYFYRVHKSFIVNMNHLSHITELGDRSYEIAFENYKKSAMMSRYKATDFFKRLSEGHAML